MRNKGSHWSCSSSSPGCGFQDGAPTFSPNFPCLSLLSCLFPEPQALCPCIDQPLPSNIHPGTTDCSNAEKMELQYQVSVGCDCTKVTGSHFSQLYYIGKHSLFLPPDHIFILTKIDTYKENEACFHGLFYPYITEVYLLLGLFIVSQVHMNS